MDFVENITRAETRIRPFVRETPLEYSHALSVLTGCNVYLKLENMQVTGSFKIRGAMNKLLSLSPAQRDNGIVAASSGNHGIAVAFGLHKLQMRGLIFVPEDASPAKVELIRHYGVEVRYHGNDCAETETFARTYALNHSMEYLSPYNDLDVMYGQGTIASELTRQLDKIDALFVSLGGGGLLSGNAGYLKALFPQITIAGCSPAHSPVMLQSIKAGHIVTMESLPTFSDGTAGGVEEDAITFPLCQQFIDVSSSVSEEEIASAFRLFLETHHQLIEGAAAVTIASLLQQKEHFQERNVVLILCGANISLETIRTILS